LTDGQLIKMGHSAATRNDRRNEFIQAARCLFNEKGFENTSIDDVAARVGVAKGLFYYYFGSKEEVLAILLEMLQDEIESAIAEVMRREGLNAVERLNALMDARQDVASRSSTLMSYFRQERNRSIRLSMERRALSFMTGPMEDIVRQGVKEGLFDTDLPRETAIALLSMAYGLSNELPETRAGTELRQQRQAMQVLSERLLGMRPGTLANSGHPPADDVHNE